AVWTVRAGRAPYGPAGAYEARTRPVADETAVYARYLGPAQQRHVMSSPWIGGLVVRRTERGQTPIADQLCARCRHHVRVVGRQAVADFVRSNPLADHRATCPANQKESASP
ncbi:MAG: hypothetical protein ACRDQ0_15265, partial [Pseudonocardia sp.]